MSLEMPAALQHAFSLLGLDWPQADEDALFAGGDRWSRYAATLREVEQTATASASAVWVDTTGPASDAFGTWWANHPQDDLREDAAACDLASVMMHGFGALTVTLKGVYIAQLVILAAEILQAVATAFFTLGASLAEIPFFASAVRVVVKEAVDRTVEQVMS